MNEFKYICVSRIDRIGDLIMTTPAIKIIRKNWPNSKIVLLVSKTNEKVLEHSNLVDKIIVINNTQNLICNLKNLKKIRKFSFDLFINFSPTYISYFFCFLSNASKKATNIYLSRYNNFVSKIVLRFFSKICCDYVNIINRKKLIESNKKIHQTLMMINLIKRIQKINFSYPDIEIPVSSVLGDKIKKLIFEKIITIHLSKRWINRYYSVYDLKNLLLELKKFKKCKFLLTTEKKSDLNFLDITKNFSLIENNHLKNLNLIKEKLTKNSIVILDGLDYEDWISIIQISQHVITPESGCTHVAAAFKIPVIVIYNQDNLPEYIYKEYGPWQSTHTKMIFQKNYNINTHILKYIKNLN